MDAITVLNGVRPHLQHKICEQRSVLNGNIIISRQRRATFGDFTLLFCRGRLGNVQNFKTHVPLCAYKKFCNCLLYLREKSKLPANRWQAYQVFVTGAIRRGKALTKSTKIFTIRPCFLQGNSLSLVPYHMHIG